MSERMTDLERAREILARYPLETAQHVIAEALAAARRKGAEEMRERAARIADEKSAYYEKRSRHTPVELDIGAVTGCEVVADAIRALPLTPEEP